jgi:hypothetical protein
LLLLRMAVDRMCLDGVAGREMCPSTSAGKKAREVPLREKAASEEPELAVSRLGSKKKAKKTKRRQKEEAARQLTSLLSTESDKLNEQLLIASEKGKQRAVFLLLHQGIDKDRCKGLVSVFLVGDWYWIGRSGRLTAIPTC